MLHLQMPDCPIDSEITLMLQVRREGNPRRRYAHVSPFMGKLQPVSDYALNCFAEIAATALPPLNGSTLVMGLAESSLLLAWWLAHVLPMPTTTLCFTSRHSCDQPHERRFTEPHSHAPCHFFSLPNEHYDQVLIVEDEVTTGTTVQHLIFALSDIAENFFVLSLSDLRTPTQKMRLYADCTEKGLRVQIIDLSTYPPVQRPTSMLHQPFIMMNTSPALEQLQQLWNHYHPDTLYVFGECIIAALNFWQSLPPANRPYLRHVTRSPWEIDHIVIHSRIDLTLNEEVPYYLYNWETPQPVQVVILHDQYTCQGAKQLALFLREQQVAVNFVEI